MAKGHILVPLSFACVCVCVREYIYVFVCVFSESCPMHNFVLLGRISELFGTNTSLKVKVTLGM